MNSLIIASLTSVIWLVASPRPSDELRRDRLPADVDFVVHVDIESFKSTQLWKHISEHSQDLDIDIDELDEVKEELGIDPLTDVKSVTLYKIESEEDPTVVLLSSNSKVDEAILKHKNEHGYKRIVSSGIELHSWADDDDEDERMFAYVHAVGEDRVVVLASNEQSAVRAARVLRGEDPNHSSAGTLLTLAPAKGSFMYFAATEIPHLDELKPASQVFGLAQGIQVDFGEAGGLLQAHMGMMTRSQKDAIDVSNVINGLISIARLAGDEMGDAIELLTGIRLSTRGTEVTLDFEFGVDRLIEILSSYDEEERADSKARDHDDDEDEDADNGPRHPVKIHKSKKK